MTLHQLRIFTIVARHLNTRAAAEELHIAQPSVSKQVATLEKEFGVKFHIKVGRRIELTKEGQLFLKDAQALLCRSENLTNKFSGISVVQKTAPLRVGGSYSPCATFLPLVLAGFKESHPLVHLVLKTDSKRALERMVLNGAVEIAVVNNPPQSPGLAAEFLGREKLLAFAPPNHPLARRGSLTISDLTRTPLVIRGDKDAGMTATEEILKEIETQGVQLKIAMRCESPEAVKAAVRNNMGLGLLFEGLIMHDVRRGDFKVLNIRELKLVAQRCIIYHKDKPLSANARAFLDLLRQQRRTRGRDMANGCIYN